jgi:hypothetical protein
VEDEGRTLFASGKVVVTTDTGTTILTPRLTWSRDSKMILSDTTVTIITRWDTLHGTGLEATEDLKKRTILEPTGVSFRSVREQEGEPADTVLADTAAPPDSAAAGGLPATGGDSLAAPGTSGADTGAVESTPPDSAGQAAHGDGGQGRGEAR